VALVEFEDGVGDVFVLFRGICEREIHCKTGAFGAWCRMQEGHKSGLSCWGDDHDCFDEYMGNNCVCLR